MSGSARISVAAAPVGFPALVVGAAVAGAGLLCYAMGKGISTGCKDLYHICKEGGYPVERLQMMHTSLSNFSGLEQALAYKGFNIQPIVPGTPDSRVCVDQPSLSCNEQATHHKAGKISFNSNFTVTNEPAVHLYSAVNKTGENIFLVDSGNGIALISERVDIVRSTIQDFATHEIINALENNNFEVVVEQRGDEKVITARDAQKSDVTVNLSTDKQGETTLTIDTRKTKKPKCDVIQQLVQARLKENRNTRVDAQSHRSTRKKADINVKVRW